MLRTQKSSTRHCGQKPEIISLIRFSPTRNSIMSPLSSDTRPDRCRAILSSSAPHLAPGRGSRRPIETVLFVLIMLTSITRFDFAFSLARRSGNHHEIRDLLRRKRTLLFPNPLESETKVQVLFGLGLPMEGEVSMTLGYVLKCNYKLPYNASSLSDGPYVRYVRDADAVGNENPENVSSRSRETGRGGISRWSLYRILEMALNSVDPAGSTDDAGAGKGCLLRAICEAAESPFHDDGTQGLAGQLFHVLLTPSTTDERYELYADREYNAAEIVGRNSNGHACRSTYPECLYSPLDYFTNKSAIFAIS